MGLLTILEIFRLVKELFSSTFCQNTVKVICEDDISVETMNIFLCFLWFLMSLMVNFFKQHTLHCWKGKVKKCLHPSSLEEQEFTIFSNQSLLRVWRFAWTSFFFFFPRALNNYYNILFLTCRVFPFIGYLYGLPRPRFISLMVIDACMNDILYKLCCLVKHWLFYIS